MNKKQFLEELTKKLEDNYDKNETLLYYENLIDEKIKNGLSEEVAIREIGTMNLSVEKIIHNDLTKDFSDRSPNKKKLIILCLLSPILIPSVVLMTLLVLIFALFVVSVFLTIFAIGIASFIVSIYALIRLSADGASAFLGLGISLFIFGGTVILSPITTKGFQIAGKFSYKTTKDFLKWLKGELLNAIY